MLFRSDADDHDHELEDDEDKNSKGKYITDIAGDIEKVLKKKPASQNGAKQTTKTQAFDSPDEGHLENPTSLLEYQEKNSPTGFVVKYPADKKYYGTYELVYLIAKMGAFTKKVLPQTDLLVGPLSDANGGPQAKGQKSHQNGLDADFAFYMRGQKASEPNAVAASGGKVSSNFMLEEQWMLFKYIVTARVNDGIAIDRIFIDGTLKQALCQYAIKKEELKRDTKSGPAFETLRRLRLWKSHANHYHVRIKCPQGKVGCWQMEDPSLTSGCF